MVKMLMSDNEKLDEFRSKLPRSEYEAYSDYSKTDSAITTVAIEILSRHYMHRLWRFQMFTKMSNRKMVRKSWTRIEFN